MTQPALQDAAPVEAILFEVGGTLYDEDKSARALLAVQEITADATSAELWAAFHAHLGQAHGSRCAEAADRFADEDRALLARAAEHPWIYPESSLYADVQPTLTVLAHQYRLGVIAHCPATVLAALHRDGLDTMFSVIVLDEQTSGAKPDQRLFGHALARLAVTGSRAVHVSSDQAASDPRPVRTAGMRTVRLLRGHASPRVAPRRLAEPDAVITTLADLPAALALLTREPDSARRSAHKGNP